MKFTNAFLVAGLLGVYSSGLVWAQQPGMLKPNASSQSEPVVAAQDIASPLRPSGAKESQTEKHFPIRTRKVPSYVTEVRLVTLRMEDGQKLPDRINQLLNTLKPEQVAVIGGQQNDDPELSNEVPATDKTYLRLTLDDQEVESLLDKLQEDTDCTIVSAPKIVTYEGQKGQVNDGVVRHFVTGIQSVEGDGFAKPGYQPSVTRFFEGTRLSVSVEPGEGQKLQLWSNVAVTEIKNVNEVPIGETPDKEEVRIQFPELEILSQDIQQEVEEGQTILISLGVRQQDVRKEVGVGIPGNKLFKKIVVKSQPQFVAVLLKVNTLDSK